MPMWTPRGFWTSTSALFHAVDTFKKLKAHKGLAVKR
jgi:hypothetical protein